MVMQSMRLRVREIIALLVLTFVWSAGCGEWTPPAPTAPTAPSGVLDTPSSGATVSGSVKPKGISALTAASTGAAATLQVTVTVVGTNISSPVDASGRFVLKGVSPGSLSLRFSGPGIEATLQVSSVDDRELVDLAVELEARFARIEASVRIKVDNSTEIDGDVTHVTGTCPNLSVVVHGWTVNMNANSQGACGDVRVGIRIKIKGTRSGSVIVVVKVDVRGAPNQPNNPNSDDDDDDDGDDDDDD